MSRSEADLLRDWLGLLRSGQYRQTREVLKDHKGYCCLGVAAEGLFDVMWEEHGENGWYEYYADGEIACDNELLPYHANAMGLHIIVGADDTKVYKGIVEHIVSGYDEEDQEALLEPFEDFGPTNSRQNWLIHLNDAGFSFEDIADFVQMAGWIPEAEAEERNNELSKFTQELEEHDD